MDTLDGISFFQSLRDSKDTQVGRAGEFFVQIIEMQVVVAYEPVHSLAYHTKPFLDDFFERTADGHDFAYGFHA